ncbi:MAG: hypothetical protein ACI8S6_004913, partial [Myxococcota bacterium]
MGEQALSRPSLKTLLVTATTMGIGIGAAEVALRAQPRLGMGTGDVIAWLLVSAVLFAAWLAAAALVAWGIGCKSRGLILSAAIVVQAALYYRFELVLNNFVYEPIVWGGLLAIAVGSLLIGLLADGLLTRTEQNLRRGLLALAAVSSVAAVVRAQPHGGQPRGERPNVVVITLDTTRPDQLSAYGSDNDTPTIARLAAEGVV